MSAASTSISSMRAITISREYGSGGGEIAARMAHALGWKLVDHEVVTQIAQRLGVEVEDAEAHDEQAESWVVHFLSTMQTVGPMVALPSHMTYPPDEVAYTKAVQEVVHGAVRAGQTVIVGRGAQLILADHRDVLHLRIVAPLEQRIKYVALRENLKREAAQQRIQQKDSQRRRYLWTTYRHMPDEAELYDLVLNTAVLDLDSCVQLAMQTLAAKAAQLSVPDGALGPSAHLAPYPARPEDFTPPLPDVAADTTPPEPSAQNSAS